MSALKYLSTICGAVFCCLLMACTPESEETERVLKVGMILPLSGPAQAWGETSLYCAQVTAAYYNEQGGVEVDGHRYRIELAVKDDALDPLRAVEAAHELVTKEEVRYVIGPLGSDTITAVAPVLDAAEVVYLHYGAAPMVATEQSFGIFACPPVMSALPEIYAYLEGLEEQVSLAVLARGTGGGIHLKGIAEQIAREQAVDLIEFSSFDVTEETVEPNASAEEVSEKFKDLIAAGPNVLLLVDMTPGEMPVILLGLNEAGYQGRIVALSHQEPYFLQGLDPYLLDRFYFIGGDLVGDEASDYHASLKERFEDLAMWQSGIDAKLYALETLLRTIQGVGAGALGDSYKLREMSESLRFDDPFYMSKRELRFDGAVASSVKRQIAIPTLLSQFLNGESRVVLRVEP